MRTALAPLLIYRSNAPYLRVELRTYADELERLYAELDAMLAERFIATAEDSGLREYEELFGPACDTLPTQTRRERLLKRLSLGEGDFTPAGVRKALESCGLACTVTEFPALNRLNLVATADYTKAEQALIRREVAKTIPPHIEYQLVFRTMTWSEHDARNKTFAALDGDSLTWEEIDSLE